MKLRNLILLALGFTFFHSAYAEPKMIRCLYLGVGGQLETEHPNDLIFDLATGTAEFRDHTEKNGEFVVKTYAAKVEEFPTMLRFTWQEPPLMAGISDYDKVTFDVDRSTLKASSSKVRVGGALSGSAFNAEFECTVEKMPKVKNKI